MDTTIEQGQPPKLRPGRRKLWRVAQSFTTPHLPDDYLALLDPRWSHREAYGTVVRIVDETPTAKTLVLEPSETWPAHQPGQYVRVGVEIDGIRHWRAYSVTSDPRHPLGYLSVTVQRIEGGLVSSFLNDRCALGDRLFLGAVEGEFRLPEHVPAKLLMLTAGCGITPVMSMLRELERRGALDDVIHLHAARTRDDFIFGGLLADLARREPGYDLQVHFTATDGRPHRQELDLQVADWRERTTFLCGPQGMMSDYERHWSEYGDRELLHMEQYRPTVGLGGGAALGESGTVAFRVSGLEAECEPGVSILVAGERAGAQLPHGCRMGICHSCIGRLQSGQVRDLRTGEVHGEAGQAVRTCVNGPCGDIEIEL